MVNVPPKIPEPIADVKLKLFVMVSEFLVEHLKEPTGKVVKWIKLEVEKKGKRRLEKSNFKLVSRLFGINDEVGLKAGAEHPQFEARISPDTKEALIYLQRLIDSDKLEAQTYLIDCPDLAYNIICLGGPVSNDISRRNMGYQRIDDEFVKISDFPIDLPFNFDLSQKGKGTASSTKRYAGWKVLREYNWDIITPYWPN